MNRRVQRPIKGVTVIALLVLVFGSASPSRADTFSLTGPSVTDCAMIIHPAGPYTGHENWGGRNFANVYEQEYGMSTAAHALLRFGLPPLGPVDITSATLTLHRDGWLSSEGTVELYRLLESWGEGTGSGSGSVYASELGGAGGTGYGPQTGAVDWFDRYHGGLSWSTPGAIGAGSSWAVPSAVYTVSGEYYFSLDVTSDVQYWYDNGANLANFGWAITSHDTDASWRVGLRLQSDDASYARPLLAVEYSVSPIPEPATLFLLGSSVAVLGLAKLKRRPRP